MTNFRGFVFAAALLLRLGVPDANAQTAFICNGAGSPVLVRGEGITELMGDIVLKCTGGIPTANGLPIPLSNMTVFLSTPNITSRLFAPPNNLSEAGFREWRYRVG